MSQYVNCDEADWKALERKYTSDVPWVWVWFVGYVESLEVAQT